MMANSSPMGQSHQNEVVVAAKGETPAEGHSPVALLFCNSKKHQDDLESLGQKIKQHEDNLVSLKADKTKLDDLILDKQVVLGKYHSSTTLKVNGEGFSHPQQGEGTVEQILRHNNSAAGLLCQLETCHVLPPSHLTLTKDVLGVVANLGKVSDGNMSSLLSEYLGVEMMLAIVCKTYEGVKALERYDENGCIDKTTGLHGLGAAVGRHLNGRFRVICLDDLRPYVGGFVADDPQRRLDLLKPRARDSEPPPGFLGFAVNMINLDASHLQYLTADGHGLRETLFYTLFHHTQVYRTRAEMLNALPFIVDGALSLDGGMIRGPGVYPLGSRDEVAVRFPVLSDSSDLPANYIETEKEMKSLKWKRERLLEDMQRERLMLDRAKSNFNRKKQEFVQFLSQTSSYVAQVTPNAASNLV